MTLTELAQSPASAVALVASVAVDADAAVVTIEGEADRATLPVVVGALARAVADAQGPVIVDLAQTTFIDAGTVRAIALASDLLDDRGRRLTVRSPSRLAMRLLEMLRITHLIESDPVVTT
jgi:anti-anti-sigma factor